MSIRLEAVAVRTIVVLVAVFFIRPCMGHCEDNEMQVYPLSKGGKAPFDGMLFPTELAIKLGFKIENLEHRLKLDVEREQKLCKANLEHKAKLFELQKSRYDFQADQMQKTIDRMQKTIDTQTKNLEDRKGTWKWLAIGIAVAVIIPIAIAHI